MRRNRRRRRSGKGTDRCYFARGAGPGPGLISSRSQGVHQRGDEAVERVRVRLAVHAEPLRPRRVRRDRTDRHHEGLRSWDRRDVAEVRDGRRRRECDRVDLARVGRAPALPGRGRPRRCGTPRAHRPCSRPGSILRGGCRARPRPGRAGPARPGVPGAGKGVEQRLCDETLGHEVGTNAAPARARSRFRGRSRRHARCRARGHRDRPARARRRRKRRRRSQR